MKAPCTAPILVGVVPDMHTVISVTIMWAMWYYLQDTQVLLAHMKAGDNLFLPASNHVIYFILGSQFLWKSDTMGQKAHSE